MLNALTLDLFKLFPSLDVICKILKYCKMENIIIHNESEKRFEITESGNTAFVEYKLSNNVIDVTHTFVPKELEGKGFGSALAKYALDYAKDKGLKVKPTCPFIRIYVERHKEYQSLL